MDFISFFFFCFLICCSIYEIIFLVYYGFIFFENSFCVVLQIIEFQKKGLPYAHTQLFLHPIHKNLTPECINQITCIKIPDETADLDGFKVVKEYMMYGPYGSANKEAQCMVKDKCMNHNPKKFYNTMNVDQDGFAIYHKCSMSSQIELKGIRLDNRSAISYNRDLIAKFQTHINVEICKSITFHQILIQICQQRTGQNNRTYCKQI